MIKKILTHKQDGSGTNNLLIGTILLFLIISIIIHESTYQRNVMAASFVDDSISTSLLGSVLANPDEYGASNQLIIYSKLMDTELTEETYNDYVEAIFLDNEHFPYYGTYVFDDLSQLTSLGDIKSSNVQGDYGPLQSFEVFEQLIKTNMNLNSDWVPNKSIYLPSKLPNGNDNKVKVETYKVYNYIECMLKHDDWNLDGNLTRPVINWSGDKVNTCSNTGDPIYSSYNELKDDNLIYSKVVCYTINYVSGTPVITDIDEFDWNENVYVTDENGNRVKGKDGNDILVEASGLYTKLSFNVNLGVRALTENPVQSRVYEEQTVFIEPNREALESGKI